MLLQGLQQQEADAVASGIVQALSRPYKLDRGMRARIGVSIGIATPADATMNERTLLLQADRALYLAKRSGKGRYHRYRQADDVAGRPQRACPEGRPEPGTDELTRAAEQLRLVCLKLQTLQSCGAPPALSDLYKVSGKVSTPRAGI